MKNLHILSLVTLVLSACFSPEQPPCSYACGDNKLCPDNYSCFPDGYCHRKGYFGACSFSDAAVPDLSADMTPVDASQIDQTVPEDLTGADLVGVDMTTVADMTAVDATDASFVAKDFSAVDFSDVDMAFQGLAPCAQIGDYAVAGSLLPTIEFGGSLGSNYSPKCLEVKLGAMVTFQGNSGADFGGHPLVDSTRGSSGNPIQSTLSGAMATFAFDEPGFFPYFCSKHGMNSGSGMAGVIHVVP